MNDVKDFLTNNSLVYVSTIGLDGHPKVRPFQFMLERDNKLYFCTSSEKDVYKQIEQHPYIEICVANTQSAWLRMHGEVVFSEDISIKEAIIERSPLVKSIYHTKDNPVFKIFYLENAKAIISDFSGNPPKYYTL